MIYEASTFKKVFYVFLSIVFVMLFCGARINLYYTNSEAETVVDELVAMYGLNGTHS